MNKFHINNHTIKLCYINFWRKSRWCYFSSKACFPTKLSIKILNIFYKKSQTTIRSIPSAATNFVFQATQMVTHQRDKGMTWRVILAVTIWSMKWSYVTENSNRCDIRMHTKRLVDSGASRSKRLGRLLQNIAGIVLTFLLLRNRANSCWYWHDPWGNL